MKKLVLKPWVRRPRSRSNERIAELELVSRMKGTAPDLTARVQFFTAVAEKAKNNRKLVEQALVHRSLKRSFRAIVDSAGFLNRKTRHEIREIMQGLYGAKKISFHKETAVDFTGTESKLAALIGKQNATTFISYFKEYLQDEKNYLEGFLKNKRTIKREKNW